MVAPGRNDILNHLLRDRNCEYDLSGTRMFGLVLGDWVELKFYFGLGGGVGEIFELGLGQQRLRLLTSENFKYLGIRPSVLACRKFTWYEVSISEVS